MVERGPVFETPRLLARRWTPEDAPAFFAIFGDAEVFRYLPGKPLATLDEARQRIQLGVEKYYVPSNGKLGLFALVEKATGDVVASSLLKSPPDATGALTADVEIGWHTARAHWGRGFASEAAAACLAYGFDELGLPEIRALVMTDNDRSQRVARKVGLRHRGTTDRYYGIVLEDFVLTRAERAAPH